MKFKTQTQVDKENDEINKLANKSGKLGVFLFIVFGFISHHQVLQPYSYYLAISGFFLMAFAGLIKTIMWSVK